jgi:histidinol phosphatase-like PHP family hydrolase
MVDKGVRFTLSDDSHGEADVGYGYERVGVYLGACGIGKVYAFGEGGGVREFDVGELEAFK